MNDEKGSIQVYGLFRDTNKAGEGFIHIQHLNAI